MNKEKCHFDEKTDELVCCSLDAKLNKISCESRDTVFWGKKKLLTELGIILLAALVILVPLAVVGIMSSLDTDLNISGNNIYQYEGTMKYIYQNGTKGHEDVLSLDIDPDNDGKYAIVDVGVENNLVASYICDQSSGQIKGTDLYTIFWIPVPNYLESIFGGQDVVEYEFDAIDPIGILGVANALYTIKITGRGGFVVGGSHTGGGQGSYEIAIYDSSDTKVGDGLIDATSGALEHFDGNIELMLDDPGNFPISKNRDAMVWIAIGIAIALPIVIFLVMLYNKKRKYSREEAEDVAILIALGGLAILYDLFVNVWFLGLFGFEYTLLTAIFLLGIFVIACIKMKISPKWCVPAVVEVVLDPVLYYLAGYSFFVYTSLLIMGFIVTFFIIVFRRGLVEKDTDLEDLNNVISLLK